VTRPRAFVELCCGSAAVTLRLLGGPSANPPVSYMGGKRGFATTILGAMGLRSGIGADSVLLCDAGPWAHVWAVLSERESCLVVAEVLRGWAVEDPRALWERLRDEHRKDWDGWTEERAAGWLWLQGRTISSAPLWYDDEGELVMPEKKNRGAGIKLAKQKAKGPDQHRADGIQRPATVATRVEAVAAFLQVQGNAVHQLPIWVQGGELVAADHATGRTFKVGRTGVGKGIGSTTVARRLDSVAAFLQVQSYTWNNLPIWTTDGEVVMGEEPSKARRGYRSPFPKACRDTGIQSTRPIADRLDDMPSGYFTVYAGRAEDVPVPSDCGGVYVYIDPPYVGCTRYAADMPREEVLATAKRWSDAGAVVCISEAVPLDLEGWHHVEITGARGGVAARTFAKQKREWLTMNREPAEVPAVQEEMFPG